MEEFNELKIFKELCENSFPFFVKQYLKVVEPETEFEWNWHMDTLCHYCERVYYGDYQNLDINIPPRMLKSLIVTVLFPCWVWTKNPACKFISASRSSDLAVKFNLKRRDVLTHESYRSLWPVHFRVDMNTTGRFANQFGGFMQAASALGKITGEGADILLSDDLLDAVDAYSKNMRETVSVWFSSAFYNRAQNKKKVKRININQRLHVDDVSGHLIKNHNFHRLVIPMIKMEKNESTVDFVDPRRVGEFIFPARYGQEEMDDDYKSMGLYGWSSQYQQQPRPIGGGIIKDEWLRKYDVLPSKFDRKIVTADLTFKGNKESDYVSLQCWGRIGQDKYLIDLVRGKWSYRETKERFSEFCEKNKADKIYVEDKANGPALISDMKEKFPRLTAWPEKGSSYMNADKIQRLHLVSQEYESGNVWVPRGIALADQFIEELTSFTEKGSSTGNDDMVDTSTMALLELKKSKTFFMG